MTQSPPSRLSDDALTERFQKAFPELAGPGTESESGEMLYGQPSLARVGPIPHLLDPATRDRENAERERRQAALTPAELAARDVTREVVRQELRMGGL